MAHGHERTAEIRAWKATKKLENLEYHIVYYISSILSQQTYISISVETIYWNTRRARCPTIGRHYRDTSAEGDESGGGGGSGGGNAFGGHRHSKKMVGIQYMVTMQYSDNRSCGKSGSSRVAGSSLDAFSSRGGGSATWDE
ncbi:hypothetical protein Glove_476g47 [Diversispora epigaea]|uniref:Uncharacterized protein n=1 Tax=Diversispora epigaea TaxID=1348612 RepID=A0A397GU50_9GLOM|nr:hypothetical protein Glove_476g47 [Diversispora epigaea]